MLVALADTLERYPVPRDALRDLIEGALWDVDRTRYETWEELREYCRRVAGTIGTRLHGRLRAVRPRARPAAGGDARPGAPADQHHARRRRGLEPRSRLPAAGRARPLRRHARTTSRPGVIGPELARPDGAPGRPGARALLSEGLGLLTLLDRRSALCVRTLPGSTRACSTRSSGAATTSSAPGLGCRRSGSSASSGPGLVTRSCDASVAGSAPSGGRRRRARRARRRPRPRGRRRRG